jgi:hypothetical protein
MFRGLRRYGGIGCAAGRRTRRSRDPRVPRRSDGRRRSGALASPIAMSSSTVTSPPGSTNRSAAQGRRPARPPRRVTSSRVQSRRPILAHRTVASPPPRAPHHRSRAGQAVRRHPTGRRTARTSVPRNPSASPRPPHRTPSALAQRARPAMSHLPRGAGLNRDESDRASPSASVEAPTRRIAMRRRLMYLAPKAQVTRFARSSLVARAEGRRAAAESLAGRAISALA